MDGLLFLGWSGLTPWSSRTGGHHRESAASYHPRYPRVNPDTTQQSAPRNLKTPTCRSREELLGSDRPPGSPGHLLRPSV